MTYEIHKHFYGSNKREEFGGGFSAEEVKDYLKGFKVTENYGDIKTYTRKNCKYYYIVIAE